ncbi:helix-turn-helix domain-containing protein [Crenobacter sp. HX-7-9]|uniref:Helix-turn-helix domain-containing protein n=1 Tax=Crenobacter caeni TaxID=2705474 RepID=A0A6B2KUF3_9NEIS|nr:helix-turn-helix domain-containing protein [Crenobacter caeni]
MQLLASEGCRPAVIGQCVGRCRSVISRELCCNRSGFGCYKASDAFPEGA